ncbi:putative ptm1 [Ixodes scapularis]
MVFLLESLCACLLVLAIVPSSSAFPDQGKWSFKVENVPKHLFAVQKSLYRASTVSIKITCDPSNPASANMNVLVGWTLLKSPCFQEFLDIETLGGTCESRCLESGVSTDPEPCGFARPRLAVRGFPVSEEKGILVVEPSPG